jgi:signal transduction histidine kinase
VGLPADLGVLSSPDGTPEAKQAARQRITDGLAKLVSPDFLDVSDPVVLVDPGGVPEAVAPSQLDNTTRLALAGGPVAEEARRSQGQRQAVTVVGKHAYAVAAAPVIVRPADAPQVFVGTVVVATPLDATYLRAIDSGPEHLSLALVTPDQVVAQAGPQPSAARLQEAAGEVVEGGRRPSGVKGSRFVVARPVAATGAQPDLALVVSVPTSTIENTRNDLFRTLFLIALFAALVAVLLAVAAGERIGRSVRRLTVAAQRIRSGDLTTRVEVHSDDELGTLGATFDEMTGSLRQAEDMKTSFLSNISHELRTPLTPIKGYTAALRRRPPTPEQAELFADEISAGVDQLERIIGQLVNFATMAAGRLDLRTGEVDSSGLLSGVVDRWTERAGRSHPLRIEVGEGAELLAVDRGYIDQALDELVDNALKYSPDGGPVVLSAECQGSDGVWLAVADEGVGMDPDAVERLSTEFAQADGSATREFGGLGLGLALVDRIARAHGGELRCRSRAGSGTVVSILVPVPSGNREAVSR